MADTPEIPQEESEELGEPVFIDPLMTAGEVAAIIGTISDADILDVEAKQNCIDDCLNIIYSCNVILKAQIKEQYPTYFESKKKKDGKANNTRVAIGTDTEGAK